MTARRRTSSFSPVTSFFTSEEVGGRCRTGGEKARWPDCIFLRGLLPRSRRSSPGHKPEKSTALKTKEDGTMLATLQGARKPTVDDRRKLKEVEQNDAQKKEQTYKGCGQTRLPMSHDADCSRKQKRTKQISVDRAAGTPGRNRRKSADEASIKQILNAESGQGNGKEKSTEMKQASQSIAALQASGSRKMVLNRAGWLRSRAAYSRKRAAPSGNGEPGNPGIQRWKENERNMSRAAWKTPTKSASGTQAPENCSESRE